MKPQCRLCGGAQNIVAWSAAKVTVPMSDLLMVWRTRDAMIHRGQGLSHRSIWDCKGLASRERASIRSFLRHSQTVVPQAVTSNIAVLYVIELANSNCVLKALHAR